MGAVRNLLAVAVIGVIVIVVFWSELFIASGVVSSSPNNNKNSGNNKDDSRLSSSATMSDRAASQKTENSGGIIADNSKPVDPRLQGSNSKFLKPADSTLCVLPVGDSLTQGVANFRGYRYFLDPVLYPEPQRRKEMVFVGTRKGTCVLGKPSLIHSALSDSPAAQQSHKLHEGHCSWGVRLLKERLMKVIVGSQGPEEQTAIRLTRPSSSAAAAEKQQQPFVNDLYEAANCIVDSNAGNGIGVDPRQEVRLRIDVALLLIGHNNVFQVASSCKLREGRLLPDRARAWLNVLTELGSAEEASMVKVLDNKHLCAWNSLKNDFLSHHTAIVKQLLSRVDGSTRVIVGLNPPTGFPNVDAMLHAVLTANVKRLAAEWNGRVTLAEFPKFGADPNVKHTFDSTHPNDAGAKVLAEGWYDALDRESRFFFPAAK